MAKIIIYPNDSGTVAILAPAPGFDIDTTATNSVPAGKSWRIIDHDELPPADEWLWSDEGPILAAPPAPAPVPASISFSQLLIGLVSEGWITEDEGRAWRDRTGLPGVVNEVISTLPAAARFAAETRALAPSEVLRADPLVAAIGVKALKSPEDLDGFFRVYSAV